MVIVVVAVVVLVILFVALGSAPMIGRFGQAAEDQMKARMPRSMDIDVDRSFKRPPDEGGLL